MTDGKEVKLQLVSTVNSQKSDDFNKSLYKQECGCALGCLVKQTLKPVFLLFFVWTFCYYALSQDDFLYLIISE